MPDRARPFWDDEIGATPEWIYDPNDRRRSRQLTIPDHWFVYAMFGTQAQPLYIGFTGNLARRLKQHSKSKVWWPSVNHIIVGLSDCESDAREWEKSYIRRAHPVHNLERYGSN